MLHKNTKLTVSNKRSVTKFFQRMIENFERKFDGFPAANESPESTPAVQEGAININPDDIARLIADSWQIDTDPCPDMSPEECVEVPSECSGKSITEQLTFSDGQLFTAPHDVDYFIEVIVDGLPMIQGVDYEVYGNSGILLDGPVDGDEIVTARYVIA